MKTVRIRVNGREIEARGGEMLAGALLRAGFKVLRRSPTGAPRSLFCGMGTCFECLVKVNGQWVRSCITPVREGMEVEVEED